MKRSLTWIAATLCLAGAACASFAASPGDEPTRMPSVVVKARMVATTFLPGGKVDERVVQASIFSFDAREPDAWVEVGSDSLSPTARLLVERTADGQWQVRGRLETAGPLAGHRQARIAWSQRVRTAVAPGRCVALAGVAPEAPAEAQGAIARGERPQRWSGRFVAHYLEIEIDPLPELAPAK